MQPTANHRSLAPGALLALTSILFGFLLGGAFGAAEDSLKGHLRDSADVVFEGVYHGDAAERDAVVSKSWAYMKRAHLHGGAIGSVAAACIALLALLGRGGRLESLSAIALGAGALFYALFWLAAGLAAPALGSTGAAKDAYSFLAIPGAGLAIGGVLGTMSSVARAALAQRT